MVSENNFDQDPMRQVKEMLGSAKGEQLLDDAGDSMAAETQLKQDNIHIYYISWNINPVYYGLTLTLNPVPGSLPTGWTNPNVIPLSGYAPTVQIDSYNFQSYIEFTAGTFPSQLFYQPYHFSFTPCGANHFQEIQIFYDQAYNPLHLVDQNGILIQLILRTP